MVRGELIGVLVVDSPLPVEFQEEDEAVLTVVATVIAQVVDADRSNTEVGERGVPPSTIACAPSSGETHVRFFAEDGSAFLEV